MLKILLEAGGLEPPTPGLQSRCSSQLSYAPGLKSDWKGIKECGAGFHVTFSSQGFQPAGATPLPLLRPAAVSPPGFAFLTRKEVIQPHLPVRLPCYDFTPLTGRTLGTAPLAVRLATSGTSDSDGVTGGVYKTRERIHRAMLMRDY